MIDVSIIIPVYNTSEYLRKCLDSVIAQTLKNIEIICIDDGSTDKSLSILQEYAKRDARIKVVHKENAGLVNVRKDGVRIAQGDFIGFVDSDDWIEPDMYEQLHKIAVDSGVEIVSSGYIQEGDYVSISHDSLPAGVYKEVCLSKIYENMILDLYTCGNGIGSGVWCKLLKGSLAKNVMPHIFSDISICEDKIITLRMLLECNSVAIVHDAYYHYVMHNTSMTHTPDGTYLVKMNAVYQALTDMYSHPRFSERMQIQAELYMTQQLLKGINTRMGFSIRNFMWIDPYWMDNFLDGTKIAVYGRGDLAMTYYHQIVSNPRLQFAGCMDFGGSRMGEEYPFDISLPCDFSGIYDYVVITIKDKKKADSVRKNLIVGGIPTEKICWFSQQEIFWRFAKAYGLLSD